MRITFLTHFPGRGGSGSLLGQLMSFFRSKGHSLALVVGDDSDDPIFDDYLVVPVKSGSPWRRRIQAYKDTVESTKPDLVYSISGKDEWDLHRFLRCPRVRHVSSMEENDWVSIPFWLRQLDGYSEAITTNTPDVLLRIQSIVRQTFVGAVAPYRIAPHFFDCPEPPAVQTRPIEICYVGRLEKFLKRVHWLPKIISGCKKNGVNIRWHIYGDGPMRDFVIRGVRARGCEADVVFHGWLESAALIAQLPRHDIFFLCSRSEGLPVAMVEAMLSGLACVAPAIPAGITYALANGGGVTYAGDSPDNAIKALVDLAQSPNLIFQKRMEAQTIARTLFCQSNVSSQLDELEFKLKSLHFNNRVLDIKNATPMRSVERFVAIRRKLLRPLAIARTLWSMVTYE